jgi:hypothetical protein
MSCLFVSLYGQVSAIAFLQEWPGTQLPMWTRFVLELAPYAYAVPVVLLASGIFLLKGRTSRPIILESVIALAWVFALVWALVAIFAWQLTRSHLVNQMSFKNVIANPASTVDGGIPVQSSIRRAWPAATDPHRSTEQ